MSDTANGLSAEYGFWLGDAFASGGSNGYDHKAVGITARGGWATVLRHFEEMGLIQKRKNTAQLPLVILLETCLEMVLSI